MHIPDGFLSTPVWAALDAGALPAIAIAARRARSEIDDARIPLLGVMGAFVFAAQMINFPVGPGTSGHLVGAALLAYTLGPSAACLVMTAILGVQALVFQDGGLLAYGANAINMAFAGVLAAHLPYRLFGKGRTRTVAIFAGAALSVLVGALLALGELLVSGVPMKAGLLGMSGVLFLVSALIEGAITVAVMRSIETLNPAWVLRETGSFRGDMMLFGGAAVSLALFGVLIASPLPDGLERFLHDMGIAAHEQKFLSTPFTDYEASFLKAEWLRKAAAGLVGLGAIFALCSVAGRLISRRRSA